MFFTHVADALRATAECALGPYACDQFEKMHEVTRLLSKAHTPGLGNLLNALPPMADTVQRSIISRWWRIKAPYGARRVQGVICPLSSLSLLPQRHRPRYGPWPLRHGHSSSSRYSILYNMIG